MIDASIIYYTSNRLDDQNPFFLRNTRKQLVKAIEDLPVICVSHKPVEKFNSGEFTNIVAGKDFKLYREGRHHLNIYWQILEGCRASKTKYVAMVEDDILYSHSHFHSTQIEKEFKNNGDVMLFDMNKVSLFTWTKPPIFSFRTKRRVVNQLIAPREMLLKAMEERFKRVEELLAEDWPENWILKYFGDPSRYEAHLGVTVQPYSEFYSQEPSIVFTHPKAYGYEFNHGKRKRHGDLRIIELQDWGRAEDVLKLWGDYPLT